MSQKLDGYNRKKYGVDNRERWKDAYKIKADSRTEDQRKADAREKAIRTCCGKIRAANPQLSNAEILRRATEWYEKTQEKKTTD